MSTLTFTKSSFSVILVDVVTVDHPLTETHAPLGFSALNVVCLLLLLTTLFLCPALAFFLLTYRGSYSLMFVLSALSFAKN